MVMHITCISMLDAIGELVRGQMPGIGMIHRGGFDGSNVIVKKVITVVGRHHQLLVERGNK